MTIFAKIIGTDEEFSFESSFVPRVGECVWHPKKHIDYNVKSVSHRLKIKRLTGEMYVGFVDIVLEKGGGC